MTRRALLLVLAGGLAACQSPTDPNSTPDLVEVTVSPDPAQASGPTGKFYKVEGDENEPDQLFEYDWQTTFTMTIRLTEDAAKEDANLDFPVRITAATLKVQQASGGIVTPPTGGETEHYESVSSASSNRFEGVNGTVGMTWEAWYDLPNQRREALITVTLVFQDEDGTSFSENVEVQVAP